jgi:cytoskeleton protein RodZ
MSEAALTPPEEQPATAGQMLKAARDRRGLHISVLAASLKVARHKIELMESDRYDELPDVSFVRALALSMCRVLKIDPEPVLAELPPSPTRMLDPSRGLNRPFRQGEPGRWPAFSERRHALSLPLLGALVLVGAGLALHFLPVDLTVLTPPWGRDASSTDGAVSAPAQLEGRPAGGEADQAAVGALAAQTASAAEFAAPSLTPPASLPAAPVLVAPAVAAPATANPDVMASTSAGILRLLASDKSWVEVRDAQGELLMARHLAAGEEVSLDGPLPLRLTVGNAAATQITFRGRPVPLAESTRENVARLELK